MLTGSRCLWPPPRGRGGGRGRDSGGLIELLQPSGLHGVSRFYGGLPFVACNDHNSRDTTQGTRGTTQGTRDYSSQAQQERRRAPRTTEIGLTLHILGIPGLGIPGLGMPGILHRALGVPHRILGMPGMPLPWSCNMGASHPIESVDSAECAVSHRRARPRPLAPFPAL